MNPPFSLPRHLILMKLTHKLRISYAKSRLHSINKTPIQKTDYHADECVIQEILYSELSLILHPRN